MMALEPRTVQCMPARLSRVAMATLHPASPTAGGSAQTLGVEFWVAHAVAVGLKIVETAASILGVRNLAPNRGQQNPEFSAVEFFLPSVRPLRSAWASGTVQSFSQIA